MRVVRKPTIKTWLLIAFLYSASLGILGRFSSAASHNYSRASERAIAAGLLLFVALPFVIRTPSVKRLWFNCFMLRLLLNVARVAAMFAQPRFAVGSPLNYASGTTFGSLDTYALTIEGLWGALLLGRSRDYGIAHQIFFAWGPPALAVSLVYALCAVWIARTCYDVAANAVPESIGHLCYRQVRSRLARIPTLRSWILLLALSGCTFGALGHLERRLTWFVPLNIVSLGAAAAGILFVGLAIASAVRSRKKIAIACFTVRFGLNALDVVAGMMGAAAGSGSVVAHALSVVQHLIALDGTLSVVVAEQFGWLSNPRLAVVRIIVGAAMSLVYGAVGVLFAGTCVGQANPTANDATASSAT